MVLVYYRKGIPDTTQNSLQFEFFKKKKKVLINLNLTEKPGKKFWLLIYRSTPL